MAFRLPPTSTLTLLLRALQVLFSALTLALSASLLTTHKWGAVPKLMCFAALTGLVSLLSALFFAASAVRPFLRRGVVAAGDGVVFFLSLVVGIVLSLRLHGTSCHNTYALLQDSDTIICGGVAGDVEDDESKFKACYYWYISGPEALAKRCVMAKVDDGFLLATAAVLGIIALMMYARVKKECREERVRLDGM